MVMTTRFALWGAGLLMAMPAYAQSDALDFLGDEEVDQASAAAPAEKPSETPSEAPAAQPVASEAAPAGEAPQPYAESIPVATKEEPMPPAPKAAPKNRLVEEIVVTAQKREENLQDVPISVQAFTGGILDARGIETTEDLPLITPGLQLSGVAGYTLIYLRGVGTDAFAPSSDPSVATYIDGVYIPAGHGILQSFGAVERVEVLKGPQGTLFGRNSTGGAISVTTKDPGLDESAGEFGAEFGNFNKRKFRGYFSTPLTDWAAVSVAALSDRRDSVYTHANPSREIPNDFINAGRVKLRLMPTETVDFTLTYFAADQQNLSTVVAKNTQPSLLGTALGIPRAEDNYETEIDYPTELKGKQEVLYGKLNWELPRFDVRLIASDVYILTDLASTDFDGSSMPIVAFDSTNQYSDYQTAELQIVSNENTWGADRFEWIAGLYALRSEVGYDPAHLFVAPDLVTGLVEDRLGIPFPDAITNLISRLPLSGTPLGNDGLSIQFRGVLGTRSYSAFTQGTWKATDALHLTVGARFQKEERFLVKSETAVQDPSRTREIKLFQFPLSQSEVSNLSPKVVLSWFPADGHMVYGSVSRGFKSATYNVVNVYEASDYVAPEEVTSYEIGSKSEFLDGNLRLNAAIFQTDIENLQSGFVSLLAGGAVTLENAGSARIRGAEFDALIVPLPNANPGLVLTAGAAYLDAIYTDYRNGSGFNSTTGVFSNNMDHTGNRIVRSPKLTANLGFVQTLEAGDDGEVEFGADWYYNSGYFFTAQNSVEQGAYDLFGARVSYLYKPWNLRVTAFGQNLADERYNIGKFELDFGVNTTLADPRTYGCKLEWTF